MHYRPVNYADPQAVNYFAGESEAAAAAAGGGGGGFEDAAGAWGRQEERAGWRRGTRGALRSLVLVGVKVGPHGAKVGRERARRDDYLP